MNHSMYPTEESIGMNCTYDNENDSTYGCNGSFEYYFYDSGFFDRTAFAVADLVIIVLSLIGNTLIIATVTCGKIRFTSTHMFFMSLAISDLAGAIFGLGGSVLTFFIGQSFFIENELLCKIPTISAYLANVSSYTLILMTIERVICVTVPFRVKQICSKTVCVATLVAVWITFTLLCAFEFVNSRHEIVQYMLVCAFVFPEHLRDEQFVSFYRGLISTISVVFPIVVNLIGTLIILVKLRSRIQSYSRFNKSTYIILINTNTVYIITRLPFEAFTYYVQDAESTNLSPEEFSIVYTVLSYLDFCNYVLNFFVYFLSGQYFRQAVYRLSKLFQIL